MSALCQGLQPPYLPSIWKLVYSLILLQKSEGEGGAQVHFLHSVPSLITEPMYDYIWHWTRMAAMNVWKYIKCVKNKVILGQIALRLCQVALKIFKNTSFLPKFSHMYQYFPPPPLFSNCEGYITVAHWLPTTHSFTYSIEWLTSYWPSCLKAIPAFILDSHLPVCNCRPVSRY